MGIYAAMKVMAVCDNLGIDRETTTLYKNIHNITKGGERGIEFFESEIGRAVFQRLFNSGKVKGKLKEETDGLGRMFTDAEFRKKSYDNYKSTILPRFHRYTWKDVFFG
jgi:hypothetical protein